MANEENKTPAKQEESKLTKAEASELVRHERTIAEGLQTFREVGAALLAIREGRLYRETHATFEKYLEGRWGITRGRAYQLIDASVVAIEVNDPNINEYAAATLNRVDEKARKKVYAKAKTIAEKAGRETPTAKDIKEATPVTPAAKNGKPDKKLVSDTFEKKVRALSSGAAEVLGWDMVSVILSGLANEASVAAKKAA